MDLDEINQKLSVSYTDPFAPGGPGKPLRSISEIVEAVLRGEETSAVVKKVVLVDEETGRVGLTEVTLGGPQPVYRRAANGRLIRIHPASARVIPFVPRRCDAHLGAVEAP